MTATNHALTGAAIGLLIGQPALALPLALVSHFVCDAIPHYATSQKNDKALKSNGFRNYLILDASFCVVLVLSLAIFQPAHWLLAAGCAFLATSPDLLWINRYRLARAGKRWRPGAYGRFARGIQWFQRPIGAVVEIAWFAGAVVLVSPFLRLG